MIHERLDIDYWKGFFSLPRLRQEAIAQKQRPPDACGITGPYDIAVLEQLQEEAFATLPGIEREPTDIFVWYRGEPEQRAVTKIGGLPYRQAGRPWPVARSGTPMNFVAQFCFADSRDITPTLPGDILLIFIEGKQWGYKDDQFTFFWGDYDDRDSEVVFEWVSLSNTPLITATEIPQTNWKIMPCYAAIHRTWDYPTVDGFAYRHVAEHITPIMEATKIGGIAPWIQGEEDIPGTFLCALHSIHPDITEPFPLLNAPEPISYDEWRGNHPLMIGDVGLMYFFINSYGDLRWTAQCS
jgi:hypothetical protein